VDFTADNWKDVIDGMYGVVNEGGEPVYGQLPHDECAARPARHSSHPRFLRHGRRAQPEHEG